MKLLLILFFLSCSNSVEDKVTPSDIELILDSPAFIYVRNGVHNIIDTLSTYLNLSDYVGRDVYVLSTSGSNRYKIKYNERVIENGGFDYEFSFSIQKDKVLIKWE